MEIDEKVNIFDQPYNLFFGLAHRSICCISLRLASVSLQTPPPTLGREGFERLPIELLGLPGDFFSQTQSLNQPLNFLVKKGVHWGLFLHPQTQGGTPEPVARRSHPLEVRKWFSRSGTSQNLIRSQRIPMMLRVLSTHLFLNHRLHPGLLEDCRPRRARRRWRSLPRASTSTTPAASTSPSWPSGSAPSRSNRFPCTHPLFPDREMGRAGAPGVNVLHPGEVAPHRRHGRDQARSRGGRTHSLPTSVVHLGERDDAWSPRTIEYAHTALEHLGAFARPLGVTPAGRKPAQRGHHPRSPDADSRAGPPRQRRQSASTSATRTSPWA